VTEPPILEGAEEFTFDGGRVGALLVHGFTGSPYGMRALGEYLAARGITVEGLRLPGHGTSWDNLNQFNRDHWEEAIFEGYRKLSERCDKTFAVGLSVGGALCLHLAARHPHLDGVVAIAPFLFTKDPLRFLAPVISRLTRSLKAVGNDIADPDVDERAYERFPTIAGASMLKMTHDIRGRLPDVRCPVLILHSKNDHTAVPDNATEIHSRISSTDKELVWYERSYHVLTLDYDKDDVYDRTFRFIKERAGDAL
jgi:carboxylesterase